MVKIKNRISTLYYKASQQKNDIQKKEAFNIINRNMTT